MVLTGSEQRRLDRAADAYSRDCRRESILGLIRISSGMLEKKGTTSGGGDKEANTAVSVAAAAAVVEKGKGSREGGNVDAPQDGGGLLSSEAWWLHFKLQAAAEASSRRS